MANIVTFKGILLSIHVLLVAYKTKVHFENPILVCISSKLMDHRKRLMDAFDRAIGISPLILIQLVFLSLFVICITQAVFYEILFRFSLFFDVLVLYF